MKRVKFLFPATLIGGIGMICHTGALASDGNSLSPDTESDSQPITVAPITLKDLSIPDSISFEAENDGLRSFSVSLSDVVNGTLKIRKDLRPRLIRLLNPDNTESEGEGKSEPDLPQETLPVNSDIDQSSEGNESENIKIIDLIPELKGNTCIFYPVEHIPDGDWQLDIPQGYFEVIPDFTEVDEFDVENEDFANFKVSGAWHFKGETWTGPGMFTIHDDDSLDGYIPSSVPSDYITTGYYSLLYPILESLGLRGCISMEGRRVGFNSAGAKLNDNGKVALRLQNERGWEIQSHSMNCIGEVLNNWVVDSLSSPLAIEISEKFPNSLINQHATSVYDRQTCKQYFPLSDNSGWQESPTRYIKPYAGDFVTKKPLLYNPDFDIDYHWGRFFRLASERGFNVNCYVCYNATSSHALISRLNEVCPHGFADSSEILINLPPLKSTVARIGLEGQVLKGYIGESDSDNTFNQEHFDFFKTKLDECRNLGGWIVLYTHAYRRCWKNYIPGALISEGGTYPDEWVDPMLGTDPLNDSLDPPARLGISDWSEWYPCPGTRCDMIWQLFKYALDSGMINVTSSEGFREFGNKRGTGYFSYGEKIGQNTFDIEGTSTYYPHFVHGVNNEVYYYNPFVSERINRPLNISTKNTIITGIITEVEDESGISRISAVSPTGIRLNVSSLKDLPNGLWIVNGKKIFIR